MIKEKKISAYQMFLILFLGRIFLPMTYMPSLTINVGLSDILFQVVFTGVLVLITSIPMFFVLRNNSNTNIIGRFSVISPVLSKVVAWLYGAVFIYIGFVTLLRFDLFATSVIFPQTDFRFFLIIIIIICAIASLFGIEAIGRTSVFLFAIIIISIVLMLSFASKEFDWLNFTPPFYDGIRNPLMASVTSMSKSMVVMTPMLLMSNVRGNIKKTTFWWITLSEGFIFILFFFVVGCMGLYASTQLFPIYSLTVLAVIGTFARLDVLLTSSWILCVFNNISLFLYIFKENMQKSVTPKYKKLYTLIGALILSVAVYLVKQNLSAIDILHNPSLDVPLYIFFVVLIPVVLLICEKIKKNRGKEP
ncbi:MAG: spore germination protein [Oscillospiraceae bacterium]|jgi:hypothetical protein|nr:spore germination protein [Oscillospiraceae bacterium]